MADNTEGTRCRQFTEVDDQNLRNKRKRYKYSGFMPSDG